ncbi:MAG TPA: trehalose-6-phosphate synthase, partial [Thermoanaerobaculia bacterium]|nr:trehalose-6-phosphate synthase [Thermoanaerobaculia bacterium]
TGWAPVHYLYRSLPRQDLVALYRLAQVGFVTSLKDGMNLVAKEYCACQTDDAPGALVLSEFAGAAAQLADGALVVNPHHVEETADVLQQALEMPADERRRRMAVMREVIAGQDIFWWVERFLRVALGEEAEMVETLRDYVPRLDTADSWADV